VLVEFESTTGLIGGYQVGLLNQVYKFDPETLAVIGVGPPAAIGQSAKLPGFAPHYGSYQLPILASPGGRPTRYKLVWGALPPGNHDEPRSCDTPGALPDCEFVSELYLVPGPGGINVGHRLALTSRLY
jgi:hypothetical protein